MFDYEDYKTEWFEFICHSGKDLSIDEVEEGVEWLYQRIGLEKPAIFLFDSYVEHKIRSSKYVNSQKLGASLGDKIRSSIVSVLQISTAAKLGIGISSTKPSYPIGVAPSFNLDNTLLTENTEDASHLHNLISTRVKNWLESRGSDFVDQGFGLGPESWLFLYHCLNKTSRLGESHSMYYQMMYAGIWCADFFERGVYISKLPLKVIRNGNLRLHSTTEPAVQWRDGSGLFFIDGVAFDKWLWNKVVNRELTCREILRLDNMEQRRAALLLYDPEAMIKELEAKLIDRSKRGNELYAIKGLVAWKKLKLLKYKDPSTDRVYVSFVPEEYEIADSAMAWKFYLTQEEYASLKEEA